MRWISVKGSWARFFSLLEGINMALLPSIHARSPSTTISFKLCVATESVVSSAYVCAHGAKSVIRQYRYFLSMA